MAMTTTAAATNDKLGLPEGAGGFLMRGGAWSQRRLPPRSKEFVFAFFVFPLLLIFFLSLSFSRCGFDHQKGINKLVINKRRGETRHPSQTPSHSLKRLPFPSRTPLVPLFFFPIPFPLDVNLVFALIQTKKTPPLTFTSTHLGLFRFGRERVARAASAPSLIA